MGGQKAAEVRGAAGSCSENVMGGSRTQFVVNEHEKYLRMVTNFIQQHFNNKLLKLHSELLMSILLLILRDCTEVKNHC